MEVPDAHYLIHALAIDHLTSWYSLDGKERQRSKNEDQISKTKSNQQNYKTLTFCCKMVEFGILYETVI